MSNDIKIIEASDENFKPLKTKEDFFNYAANYHGERVHDLQKLINKDDWTLMQKIFGPRELIRVAKDQRITQVKNGFDLINKAEKITNEVIISALKNRAEAVLTSDYMRIKQEVIIDVNESLQSLTTSLDVSRKAFLKYMDTTMTDLEQYKDKPYIYNKYKDSFEQECETYFTVRKNQINNFADKIKSIEEKYK